MNIREASIEDYEELMKLYNLFVKEDRYSRHDFDSFEKVLKSTTSFIYVAEIDNELAGLATFSIRTVVRYPRPISELDELFVLEKFREHGIGKKLMDIVEEKAKSLNCLNMFIESAYDRTTAHKFYESLGFKNEGFHFKKPFNLQSPYFFFNKHIQLSIQHCIGVACLHTGP